MFGSVYNFTVFTNLINDIYTYKKCKVCKSEKKVFQPLSEMLRLFKASRSTKPPLLSDRSQRSREDLLLFLEQGVLSSSQTDLIMQRFKNLHTFSMTILYIHVKNMGKHGTLL